jgi:hypothetical protein
MLAGKEFDSDCRLIFLYVPKLNKCEENREGQIHDVS